MIKTLIFVTTFAIGFCQFLTDSQKSPIDTVFCLLPSNKGYGLCIDLYKCGPAWKAFTEFFVSPTYCNYDSSEQTVCCDVSSKNVSLKLVEERISVQRCQQAYPRLSPFAGVDTVPKTNGEFQHMAAIAWRTENGGYDYLCGGSLISAAFVLTAAHCTRLKAGTPDSIRIGGVKTNETSGEGHISIKRIIVHPEYLSSQVYNDIAILELEKPSSHPPACLWQTTEIGDLEPVAIGYGPTTISENGSDLLIKVNLSIIDTDDCKLSYKPGYKLENGLNESQLCAADREKKRDICQGDFSGLLMVKVYESSSSAPYYIVGITSFGQGCASGPPTVYTRVSSFLDWIESIVWPSGKAKGYFRVD